MMNHQYVHDQYHACACIFMIVRMHKVAHKALIYACIYNALYSYFSRCVCVYVAMPHRKTGLVSWHFDVVQHVQCTWISLMLNKSNNWPY